MKSNKTYTILAFVLMLAFAGGTALANDKIISTITIPTGQPVPVIEDNGVASGNIRLNYTVVGTQFPCGTTAFASFKLNLDGKAGTGQTGTYPADLNLAESGNGTPVDLSPVPNYFSVGGATFSNSSLVTITIDCGKLDGPPADGDVIDGQMNEKATVPSSNKSAHIDTITTVQVHIKLVFPTACLKLYSFESDQDSGVLLADPLEVKIGKHDGNVTATTPVGQISVDALVANICASTETFDLLIDLGPWHTNPHGNPGNATFIFTTAGEIDPDTYNLAEFGTGTPKGQALCMTNVALTGGSSFLTRVHSSLQNVPGTNLPEVNVLTGEGRFQFGATLFPAGSACTGTALGQSIVGPTNPAVSSLSFSIK